MNDKVFEALNELEEEAKWCHNDGETLTKYDEERFNVIRQALTTKSEKEQAFEIMAYKEVDIDTFIGCTEVRQYNLKSRSSYALTEKEFNFLKEIVFPTIVEVDEREERK